MFYWEMSPTSLSLDMKTYFRTGYKSAWLMAGHVLYIGFKTSDQQSSPLLCTGIAGKRRNTPNTLRLTSITENKCLSLHVSLLLKGVLELCGVVVQLKPQLDLFYM